MSYVAFDGSLAKQMDPSLKYYLEIYHYDVMK
jgi:hypothetical protein